MTSAEVLDSRFVVWLTAFNIVATAAMIEWRVLLL